MSKWFHVLIFWFCTFYCFLNLILKQNFKICYFLCYSTVYMFVFTLWIFCQLFRGQLPLTIMSLNIPTEKILSLVFVQWCRIISNQSDFIILIHFIFVSVFLQASDLIITPATTFKEKPDPTGLVFGTVFTDNMLTIQWSLASGWEKPYIKPLENLSLHPASSALHYATEVSSKLIWKPPFWFISSGSHSFVLTRTITALSSLVLSYILFC